MWLFTGIGAAVARAFAVSGCLDIALCDIHTTGLETTQQLINKDVSPGTNLNISLYTCNVADPASVIETFAKILSKYKRIDYAVNSAGVNTTNKPSTESTVEEWDRINGINLRGLWLCVREEIRAMKTQTLSCESYLDSNIPPHRAQRGAIVNIASGAGLVAIPNSPAYCASKGGVIALTRTDAIDYSLHRIRVNCVCPGITDTPMIDSAPGEKQMLEKAIVPQVPMKRLGQPEEIADAVLFLCSHKASYMQGAALAVDGGYLAV